MENEGSFLSNTRLTDNIEKLLFFLSLLIIPISILPFPWDLTEFSMSIVMLFFAILILSIELMKLVWRGRMSVSRSLIDTGVLLLAGSIVVSTIFSRSSPTSLYGFDFRLGSGMITFLVTLIYMYSARVFLKSVDDVVTSLRFLLVGITVASLISILSFWGLNVLSFIPSFDSLFTVGLPIYSSARVSLVIWGVSIILGITLLFEALKNGKLTYLVLPLIALAVNLAALTVFSVVQGWEHVVALIVSAVALLGLPLIRKRPLNKTFVWTTFISALIILLVFGLFRIPQFKDVLVKDSSSLITQLTIDPQVSWRVATSSVSESVWRGLVGFGQDTFSIAYNLYRPLTTETVLLNATNFTTASVHVVNVLATRGVFGILTWLALGFFIGKTFYDDIKKSKFEDIIDFLLVGLNIAIVYIFISSFLIYFTFMVMFLLLALITLSVILRSVKEKGGSESFVVNLGFFLRKQGEGSSRPAATTVAIVIGILGIVAIISLGRYTVASAYVLEAEQISADGRELIEADELSDSERADMLVNASNLYGKAVVLSPSNDVLHRRASLIVVQYIEYLAEKYNNTEIEDEKKALFDEISIYIEIVVEESKTATELNPEVYSNWGARASTYSKLVGLGLNSYSRSALTAMQNAAALNPLNYELYYNAAQLYVVNDDNDSALRTLSQVFSINPDHIPSLVLAGELSSTEGDQRQALRYFEDAKTVMDGLGSTDSDIYDYVVKKIAELDQGGGEIQGSPVESEGA